MAYKVLEEECLRCGVCLSKCPAEAIIADDKIEVEGMMLQPVHIDAELCTDCGTCVSEEFWCPGQAITRA